MKEFLFAVLAMTGMSTMLPDAAAEQPVKVYILAGQ